MNHGFVFAKKDGQRHTLTTVFVAILSVASFYWEGTERRRIRWRSRGESFDLFSLLGG